jgi:hypothetical protein
MQSPLRCTSSYGEVVARNCIQSIVVYVSLQMYTYLTALAKAKSKHVHKNDKLCLLVRHFNVLFCKTEMVH